MDSSYLIDERNIFPERVQRRSGGLGEIGAVEWVGIIQELDPTHKRGHGASMQGEFGSENGGCTAAASDRQAGRQAAPPGREQVLCSSKNPINLGPSPFVSRSGEVSPDSERTTSEGPGYLQSERRGNEPGGHVRGHGVRLMR